MGYYEAIWENGSKSVMECDSDEEAAEGVMAQNEKAVAGESGGPTGHPASRVKTLLAYGDTHPGDFGADGTLSKDEVKKMLADYGDVVNVDQLIAGLRDAIHAVDHDGGPHDSMYKMPEDHEVALAV